ncbi:MAG: hypothetical protein WCT14_00050 [Treponemataceae bacterium]
MLCRLASRLVICALFSVSSFVSFSAESVVVPPRTEAPARPTVIPEPPFPVAYFADQIEAEIKAERARPYWVATELEDYAAARRVSDYQSILLNNDIVAFYGTPLSKRMGVLGVHPLPELDRMLSDYAAVYDVSNGDRGVKKAFYIIYGMAWPQGEIGILRDSRLNEYIEYALANDMLVFIDHQIGKYSVESATKRLLPFLRYPNVHLALDPEWRTLKPMDEIGSVSADEINKAQRMMEDYLVEHGYPGERLLVIHQFNMKMIAGRERVLTDFARVRLIHCADGFGLPAVKRQAYYYNVLAKNMPIKAFKLFFKSGVPGTGFDEPLMRPEEVLALDPRPSLIMYQ